MRESRRREQYESEMENMEDDASLLFMLWFLNSQATSTAILECSSITSEAPQATTIPINYIAMFLCFVMLNSFSLASASASASSGAKRLWKRPRPESRWSQTERRIRFMDTFSRDREWRRSYRMSYAAYLYLVEELRPHLQLHTAFVREPIEVEKAVAMVLYRLATGHPAAKVAEKYNVGRSTLWKYTMTITAILASRDKMYSKYIAIPTGERLSRIIAKFQSLTTIPNMCGAVDGTHVKLKYKPGKDYNSVDYCGKRKFYSILLQGICDADKLFWDVCCKAPGAAHDASHFKNSNVGQLLHDRDVLVEPAIIVQGAVVQPYLVGDSAYPLRPYLMKPYKDKQCDMNKDSFDEHLRNGFVKIENAFGILKSWWRILLDLDVYLKSAAQTVVACCVLHNFCQLWGEPEPKEQEDPYPNTNPMPCRHLDEGEATLRKDGEEVRDALFLDFMQRQDRELSLKLKRYRI